MNVFVLGDRGMLGSQVVRTCGAAGHQVHGADLPELDISDLDALRAALGAAAPRVVINCAAFTDVDRCEREPEAAFRANALGPRHAAVCCDELGATLIHLSTDYVFDGRATRPYRELDPTGPQGVYGASKLAGEWGVQRFCRRFCIVRTAWLYGPGGRHFVGAILERARRGEPLRVVDDQQGSPTYTPHLAAQLLALAERGALGLFHATGGGSCSWLELARQALELAGLTGVSLTAISTAELGRPAPRPAYSVLDNFNLRVEGIEAAPPWQQALAEFLARPER